MSRPLPIALALLVLCPLPLAAAGPIWDEPNDDDAGPLPTNAQVPGDFGVPTIERIRGNLFGDGGLDGGGDFQDMYKIYISVPSMFSASTSTSMGGFADFDTQLFLFDEDGKGVIANNDFTGAPNPGGSFLPKASDDGSGGEVLVEGVYFLAISGFPSVPVDSSGTALFAFATPSEVSGPDGSTDPIAGWSGPGAIGEYEIVLTGVIPVPAPGASALLAAGGLLAARRRRCP